MSRKRSLSNATIPKPILDLADTMYMTWLSGYRDDAANVRRRLVRMIFKALDDDARNVRLLCLLGDIYSLRKKKIEFFRRALKVCPNDPEANAEISRIYAEMGDQRYAAHFDVALKHCRGFDVEDSVIHCALDAARAVEDGKRVRQAMKLGQKRFPGDSLFDPK